MRKILRLQEEFELELGGALTGVEIAYHTFGRLNSRGDNVVWVCHALTADSDVDGWWPNTVTEEGFLNPSENFIICANILGSCYGTTGPLSVNPQTSEPYYDSFPPLTVRDWVKAHRLLADSLGVKRIKSLVGSSVGGFQALEWAVTEPERFDNLILIATSAKASPWTIAIDETQRMAIKADPTYGLRSADGGRRGLAAARAIGLLSYRGPEAYNISQQDKADTLPPALHRAATYQRHQGDKLVGRFNAYSYVAILDAFDTHDIGRGRGGVAAALRTITAATTVVGITTDIVFTPAEMRSLAAAIPGGRYFEIESDFGHDGFLVEHQQLNRLLLQNKHQA